MQVGDDMGLVIRNTMPEDFFDIVALWRRIYPATPPWRADQLAAQLRHFPEGQVVAVDVETGVVVGLAASLVLVWDEPYLPMSWPELISDGYFSAHDPELGSTLCLAEMLTDPDMPDRQIGERLLDFLQEHVIRLGLPCLRYVATVTTDATGTAPLSHEAYLAAVQDGQIADLPVTSCLSRGFLPLPVPDGDGMTDELDPFLVLEWRNPKAGTSWQQRFGLQRVGEGANA